MKKAIRLVFRGFELQTKGYLIHSPKHCMPANSWYNIRPAGKFSVIDGINEGLNQMLLQSLLKIHSESTLIRTTDPAVNLREAEEKKLFARQVIPHLKRSLPP